MTNAEAKARVEAKKAAKRLGVKIVSGPWAHGWEITVEAPDGQHWEVTKCHDLIANQRNRGPWGIGELWVSIAEDIKHGLEPCDVECGHLDEEIYQAPT